MASNFYVTNVDNYYCFFNTALCMSSAYKLCGGFAWIEPIMDYRSDVWLTNVAIQGNHRLAIDIKAT
jgi:hypothetical protein